MKIDEKIVIALGAVLLVVLIITHRNPQPGVDVPESYSPIDDVGVSMTPYNTSMAKGPAYLTYNQPWAFSPPVGNILPAQTTGQMGAYSSLASTSTPYCETC